MTEPEQDRLQEWAQTVGGRVEQSAGQAPGTEVTRSVQAAELDAP